jgi:hypothetical protein
MAKSLRGVDSEGYARAKGGSATKLSKTKSQVGGDSETPRQSSVNNGRVTMAELKMR